MSDRKPLVLGDDTSLQQLQHPDDLDIPLVERVSALEHRITLLTTTLLLHGIELPEELANES